MVGKALCVSELLTKGAGRAVNALHAAAGVWQPAAANWVVWHCLLLHTAVTIYMFTHLTQGFCSCQCAQLHVVIELLPLLNLQLCDRLAVCILFEFRTPIASGPFLRLCFTLCMLYTGAGAWMSLAHLAAVAAGG